MTQQPPDDFERRLRDVLSSRGLGVPVPPDAIDRIHAGARRRQQRRTGASALGAVAIIAIAAVAIGVRPHGHGGSNVAANLRTASPSPTVAAASSATPAPSPSAPASSLTLGSATPFSSAPPASPLPEPQTSESIAASQPGGFTPVSVSAVGLNDYWVLGFTTTKTSSGYAATPAVEQTTDGGLHFTSDTTPPALVAQEQPRGRDTTTISQIRFGDTKDGWAFGPALYSTTDGGTSWAAVNGIAGGVVDLVAANNTAWALVQTASSSGASGSAVSDQYALFSTSYGKGAQAWSQVALPITLGSTTPSIVDQDGTVTVMAPGPSSTGNKVHVLIGTAGKPFTDHTGPCEQDFGGTLSNSKKGVWAVCPHGNGAALYISADSGATWAASKANVEVETGAAIGAIDDSTAVFFEAANQRLTKISGSTSAPTNATSISDVTFLGFTTPAVGFAITVGENGTSTQLLRTADGGATWSAVTF
jgi:hypothetical protein